MLIPTISFSTRYNELICLKHNNDGSTTVIASCKDVSGKSPAEANSWKIEPGANHRNSVNGMALTLLIAQAYSALINVGVLRDLLSKDNTTSEIRE